MDALQRLSLIVSATKYPRRLEKMCLDLLQTTLCLPTSPEQLQGLCAAILREMSPFDDLALSCDHTQNTRQLSLLASVLLAQGDRKGEIRCVSQRIFKILENRQPEGPSVRHLLPVLSKVIGLAPGTLMEGTGHFFPKGLLGSFPTATDSRVWWKEGYTVGEPCITSQVVPMVWGSVEPHFLLSKLATTWEPRGLTFHHCTPPLPTDQTNLLSKRLVDWLRYASIQQGLPYSGGFFSTPRTRQPGPITEVDGAVASDFFTVLSTGQHFTEDQWLNMQAFSMLRKWLLHSGPEDPGSPDADDKSELEGSTLSVLSATSTASRLLPPRERLREVAFEYCQRLLEQSNRRALRKGDSDLQKACLVEAVLVLDVLCRQDPSFLYRTLSCLKALHRRLGEDPGSERALVPLAQFFLNHGEAAAMDAEAIYQHLLSRLPSERFYSPTLAFEVIHFCTHNLTLFDPHFLNLLRLSFPSLFKFLAWNSPPLTAEFMVLLPALVDAGTAVEMLHALLDLPCLTAALDLQLRSTQTPSERPLWDVSLKIPSCLEAFRDPQLQGLFRHLLRTKASGSTERLMPLHQLLKPMASCARVTQCAEAVPILLQAFFSAVTQFADGALINQLALLLLDRSDSLYQVPQYEAHVHRMLSSQFLVLCKLKPSLVVELSRELLEFMGSVSSICSRASMFTCVVWAIGEYLSVTCDKRCTVEQINRFFEALEALLFEVTQSRPSADLPCCPPQVVTALMTTLTKLASRSQDLIPRVSLFLSKIRTLAQNPATNSEHSEEEAEAIRTRATELLALLKMPSVAQFVFTPTAGVCQPRYHRDTNTALPLALHTVSRLVEKEAGLLPG
ncbi:AP-5 complex subunit zeta-1 isoform X3 [Peromyscus californicus insignis]|nr:AP-5 complex subunit zeta-1 isoform X3 [Peromyscus californicus insignis]XP_052610148.1 AP-5 complex subunit zeta-1 isoform X3 [Peromyscus californicus insignis]